MHYSACFKMACYTKLQINTMTMFTESCILGPSGGEPFKDACMQIWSRAQTVLGLGAYGPQKYFNIFLSFTLSYGLPESSVEPAQGRFHPTSVSC